jgi:hypothetical protein
MSFISDRVTNSDEALRYMVECTLATVDYMAELSRPPKGEYHRQIEMAQKGLNFIREFGITPTGRIADIVKNHNWDVKNWADQIRSTR